MTHIDELGMVANLCLKSFKNQKTLTFHVKYVHQNMWHYQSKPVQCKVCNKTFYGNNILKRHFDQVHLGHRNYICEKCGQSFQNSRNLVKHFKKVHLDIEDKSECDFCKKLISNRYMKDHKNAIHLNIRNFKCTCCDKNFNLMSVMKMHVKRVHLRKKKSFNCYICNDVFSSKKSLTKHEIFHNESTFNRDNDKNILEKPKAYQICQKHKCDVCGKNFASNSKLQRHINGLHKKNKNFHCNWCEMKYDWKQSLDNHVRTVHGNKNVQFVNRVYQKQDRIQKEGIKIMVENTDVENIDHKHKSTSATKNELSSKNECLQCMVCNEILKTHVDFFEHVEKKHEIES